MIEDSDIIGLGWTTGAPLVNINDSEKYVFKFIKEKSMSFLTDRIQFQSENELDDLEAEIAKFDETSKTNDSKNEEQLRSPLLSSKLSLKRKIDNNIKVKEEPKNNIFNNGSIINISDSESEIHIPSADLSAKKPKLQAINEEPQKQLLKEKDIKTENELNEYEAFSVKQEYLGYEDDEPIKIDSESDSESEQWLIRLSQNSPGKPFTKLSKTIKPEIKPEDGSYSQLDDDFISHLIFEDDEEFKDNIIPEPEDNSHEVPDINKPDDQHHEEMIDEDDFSDDIISIPKEPSSLQLPKIVDGISRDVVDGFATDNVAKQIKSVVKSPVNEPHKKAQMIDPLAQLPKGKSHRTITSKLKNYLHGSYYRKSMNCMLYFYGHDL